MRFCSGWSGRLVCWAGRISSCGTIVLSRTQERLARASPLSAGWEQLTGQVRRRHRAFSAEHEADRSIAFRGHAMIIREVLLLAVQRADAVCSTWIVRPPIVGVARESERSIRH
jgi:hypothetical protein